MYEALWTCGWALASARTVARDVADINHDASVLAELLAPELPFAIEPEPDLTILGPSRPHKYPIDRWWL
jgi:hypothetical protein